MNIIIKQEFADAILTTVNLQARIANDTKRSIETVKRWARERSEMLLLENVQDAIRHELKLDPSAELSEPVAENISQ